MIVFRVWSYDDGTEKEAAKLRHFIDEPTYADLHWVFFLKLHTSVFERWNVILMALWDQTPKSPMSITLHPCQSCRMPGEVKQNEIVPKLGS